MSTLVTLEQLRQWRDRAAAYEVAGGAEEFMGKPAAWYEDPYWFCANGHVSGNYLKCEEEGELCLECMQPVLLGPPVGERAFKTIVPLMRDL